MQEHTFLLEAFYSVEFRCNYPKPEDSKCGAVTDVRLAKFEELSEGEHVLVLSSTGNKVFTHNEDYDCVIVTKLAEQSPVTHIRKTETLAVVKVEPPFPLTVHAVSWIGIVENDSYTNSRLELQDGVFLAFEKEWFVNTNKNGEKPLYVPLRVFFEPQITLELDRNSLDGKPDTVLRKYILDSSFCKPVLKEKSCEPTTTFFVLTDNEGEEKHVFVRNNWQPCTGVFARFFVNVLNIVVSKVPALRFFSVFLESASEATALPLLLTSLKRKNNLFLTQNTAELVLPSALTLPFEGAADFVALFESTSLRKVLQILAALLRERKVLLCAATLRSGVVEAVRLLLLPFEWQFTYIPFLEPFLMELLESPLPFFFAVETRVLSNFFNSGKAAFLQAALDSGDLQLVDLDSTTHSPTFFDMFFVELVEDLRFGGLFFDATDGNLLETSSPNVEGVRLAFFRLFVKLVGPEFGSLLVFPRIVGESVTQEIDDLLDTENFLAYQERRSVGQKGVKGWFKQLLNSELDKLVAFWERFIDSHTFFSFAINCSLYKAVHVYAFTDGNVAALFKACAHQELNKCRGFIADLLKTEHPLQVHKVLSLEEMAPVLGTNTPVTWRTLKEQPDFLLRLLRLNEIEPKSVVKFLSHSKTGQHVLEVQSNIRERLAGEQKRRRSSLLSTAMPRKKSRRMSTLVGVRTLFRDWQHVINRELQQLHEKNELAQKLKPVKRLAELIKKELVQNRKHLSPNLVLKNPHFNTFAEKALAICVCSKDHMAEAKDNYLRLLGFYSAIVDVFALFFLSRQVYERLSLAQSEFDRFFAHVRGLQKRTFGSTSTVFVFALLALCVKLGKEKEADSLFRFATENFVAPPEDSVLASANCSFESAAQKPSEVTAELRLFHVCVCRSVLTTAQVLCAFLESEELAVECANCGHSFLPKLEVQFTGEVERCFFLPPKELFKQIARIYDGDATSLFALFEEVSASTDFSLRDLLTKEANLFWNVLFYFKYLELECSVLESGFVVTLIEIVEEEPVFEMDEDLQKIALAVEKGSLESAVMLALTLRKVKRHENNTKQTPVFASLLSILQTLNAKEKLRMNEISFLDEYDKVLAHMDSQLKDEIRLRDRKKSTFESLFEYCVYKTRKLN